MRSCFLGSVTLVAMGLVAAALWFGAAGFLASDGILVGKSSITAVASLSVPERPGADISRPTGSVTAPGPLSSGTPSLSETELARLTDTDLTLALRRAVAAEQGGVLITDPTVRISGGKLELTGQLRGLVPLPVDVRVVGRIEIRDGQPIVVVERVEGVGVPLPALAARRLEVLINSLTVVPLPADVIVTRIDAGDGVLTVIGRRR